MQAFAYKARKRLLLGLAAALAAALVSLLCPREASAYTWMVRHGYSNCAPCHLNPSGGSVLSPYGRAVGGTLLSTEYINRAGDAEAANSLDEFAFGLVPLPEWLMVGGDVRLLSLWNKLEGVEADQETILMQTDLQAAVKYKHFLASASLGYASQGAYAAAITDAPEDNLVSRHHWLGYEFDEASGLIVRAGRMNLPFGIRSVEHTLWVRSETDTNIESDQQHGIAVAWSPGFFRSELMLILGNYQIQPDEYRERGYAGYFEWQPLAGLGVGVSSLLTHRDLDEVRLKETWRQAHGLYARWSTPFKPLVLLAEGDYVYVSSKNEFHRKGMTGYLQADLEAFRGLHLLLTAELEDVGLDDNPASFGVWFSQAWFFAPHADVRVDGIYQRLGDEFGAIDSLSVLLQGHFYL